MAEPHTPDALSAPVMQGNASPDAPGTEIAASVGVPIEVVSSATGEGSPVPAQMDGGAVTRPASVSPRDDRMIGPAVGQLPYVYALGRVEPRFPSQAVEKEFVQVTGRSETAGLTDREALHAVLSNPQNRYLARLLAWVFTIEGLDTYLVVPRDPADLDLLIEAIRPVPRPSDIDVVIGVRGPIAPHEMAGGLMVPIVVFDQLYSFDIDALVTSIPRPEEISAKRFKPTAEELFSRVMQLADNAGATDEHRALNYLAVRYPAIYAKVAEAHERNAALSAVEVRRSRLSGARNIVDVIFTFTDRATDVTDSSFVRVDVTERFPFLITKLSPYYEH
jgi:PatG C-terminal